MRTHDLAQPLIRTLVRLLDWSLAQPRTEWIIAWLTAATAVYFWCAKGFAGLMEQLQNVATIAALYGPALWLRKQRNIPAARSVRQDRLEDQEKEAERNNP